MLSISFFCPAYNEAKNIASIIQHAEAVLSQKAQDYEIIVVDDGSTDETAKVVSELAKVNSHVRLLRHGKNLGYGSSVWTGLNSAAKEWVVYADADGQIDLEDIPKLIEEAKHKNLIVVGRRELLTGYGFFRRICHAMYNKTINILLGLPLKDVNCALKIFPKEAIKKIKPKESFLFLVAEVQYLLWKEGYSFKEIPVKHLPRKSGKSGLFTPAKIARIVYETLWGIIRLRFF